ncbi:acid protease, partial [Wilcoxina mikolae CBS 423.85]
GNDGNWSTFSIRIDNNPNEQYARVLPATDSFETWIVSVQACRKNDTLCISQRGGSLNTTNSTSWEAQGPYQLEMSSYLFNYSNPKWGTNFSLPPRGDYGLATLGLTRQSTGPTLKKQVVATFQAVGFYLGFFGLASDDTDFGDGIKHPSYLTSLYNESKIPSMSWGYQAGAAYRKTASLVLGGYDGGRFKSNDATFNLTSVETKNVQAPLTSLTVDLSDGTSLGNIISKPINASINSVTSYIWLPKETCQKLEKAFNITWNATEELYLLEPWTYQALVAANPSFTFTLANGSSKVDIVIPYAAMDLDIVLPITAVVPRNNTQKYFPVKRAWDNSQYTLGRVFLHEAYLQVDYHRRTFKISQAAW